MFHCLKSRLWRGWDGLHYAQQFVPHPSFHKQVQESPTQKRAVTVYCFVNVMDCFLIMMDELELILMRLVTYFHCQTSWHTFTSYLFFLLERVNVFILPYLCGLGSNLPSPLEFCHCKLFSFPCVISITPEFVLPFDWISLLGLFASHFQPQWVTNLSFCCGGQISTDTSYNSIQ